MKFAGFRCNYTNFGVWFKRIFSRKYSLKSNTEVCVVVPKSCDFHICLQNAYLYDNSFLRTPPSCGAAMELHKLFCEAEDGNSVHQIVLIRKKSLCSPIAAPHEGGIRKKKLSKKYALWGQIWKSQDFTTTTQTSVFDLREYFQGNILLNQIQKFV